MITEKIGVILIVLIVSILLLLLVAALIEGDASFLLLWLIGGIGGMLLIFMILFTPSKKMDNQEVDTSITDEISQQTDENSRNLTEMFSNLFHKENSLEERIQQYSKRTIIYKLFKSCLDLLSGIAICVVSALFYRTVKIEKNKKDEMTDLQKVSFTALPVIGFTLICYNATKIAQYLIFSNLFI